MMTRTSPLSSLMMMFCLALMAGVFALIMLGSAGISPPATTTVQTSTQVNALNITQSRANFHEGAPLAWKNYRNGICENKQVYYKPASGYMMISCQISGTDQCAQLIFQVTEHTPDGLTAMSPGMYIHGQLHSCGHVNGYLAKRNGGYTAWDQVVASAKDVITTAFGEP